MVLEMFIDGAESETDTGWWALSSWCSSPSRGQSADRPTDGKGGRSAASPPSRRAGSSLVLGAGLVPWMVLPFPGGTGLPSPCSPCFFPKSSGPVLEPRLSV